MSQVIDSEAPEAVETAAAGDGRAAPTRRRAGRGGGRGAGGMMADAAARVDRIARADGNPFDPGRRRAPTGEWRAAKLAAFPVDLAALIVEVGDPRALTVAERAAHARALPRWPTWSSTLARCAMPTRRSPRALGAQLGLARLDRNCLADDDGMSQVTVTGEAGRGEYIPYTNRPIRWHTDGYYNPPERRIRAMVLHCVAARGAKAASMRSSTTRSPTCCCATRIPRTFAR